MHPQHSSRGSTAPAPSGDHDAQETYERDQRGLLDLLLEQFPGVLTYREARVDDPEDFGEADRFANAARGLIASGLAVRQGALIIPSRPAREMAVLGFNLG